MKISGKRQSVGMGCLLCILSIALVVFLVGTQASRDPSHEHFLARVPIGASVADLEKASQECGFTDGSVMQWIAAPERVPDRSDIQIKLEGVTISTEFGIFLQKDLGRYSDWYSSGNTAEFTGEVIFYVHPPFRNSVIVGFTFIEGTLVKKDWGYLPG